MYTEQINEENIIIKKERKRFKDSFPKQLIFCMLCIVCVILLDKFCVALIENSKYNAAVNGRKETISQDVIYEIGKIEATDSRLTVSGWVAWEDIAWEEVAIVLQMTDSLENIVSKAELTSHLNVNTYCDGKAEIKASGFMAEIDTKDLKKNSCYEILIDLSYKTVDEQGKAFRPGIKISTNKFLFNDCEYEYDPLTFLEPKISDEGWQSIIKSGKLCGYSKEEGTWIYLYEGVLYFIIISDRMPALDKAPSIPIKIYTTRGDLVPISLLDEYNQNGYVYEEIYLKEEQLLKEDEVEYYVVSYRLPTEFPILYVQTGPYSNSGKKGWIYTSNFRVHSLDEMKQWD